MDKITIPFQQKPNQKNLNQTKSTQMCNRHESKLMELSKDKLLKIIDELNKKTEILKKENLELTNANKMLRTKFQTLLNDKKLISIVKSDLLDYSSYEVPKGDDTLKEFFFLLLMTHKMKYLEFDEIWMLDANELYSQAKHLAFYDYNDFLTAKISSIKDKKNASTNNGCLAKIK